MAETAGFLGEPERFVVFVVPAAGPSGCKHPVGVDSEFAVFTTPERSILRNQFFGIVSVGQQLDMVEKVVLQAVHIVGSDSIYAQTISTTTACYQEEDKEKK